jgi:hypothetical protein
MTQASEELLRLAESWEAKAKSARKIECAPEYQAYWRGYAEAFQEAAEVLAGRSLARGNQ